MRSPNRWPVALVTLLLVTTTGAVAGAQSSSDRATARGLGREGEAALAVKEYKKAEDDFRRADALVHAPTLMLGLARALAAQGKYVDAQEAYKRIIREGVSPGAPDVFAQALESAKKEVDGVGTHIAALTIKITGAGGAPVPDPKVTLDDVPVSVASLDVKRYVDPGAHVVRATAAGYKGGDVKVVVADGGNATAQVTLEQDAAAPAGAAAVTPAPSNPDVAPPAPAPRSSGASPWPWVAFGIGGAGLGVGVVTAVLAAGKHGDLSTACAGGRCPPDQYGNLDSYHTLSLVSSAGFIVAGLGAATGVTLLLLQPKTESGPPTSALRLRVCPFVGPGSVGATGTF